MLIACLSARGPHFARALSALFLLILAVGCNASSSAIDAASSASDSEEERTQTEVEPLASEEATPPISLGIPAIELEVPVMPMGWRVVEADDGRSTEWVVPDAAAGWHINSAKAGAAGNVVLSGKQVGNRAAFVSLALGEVEVGQEVLLADEQGNVFVYRVREISEPIPIAGATPEEEAQSAAYLAPTDEAVLTLVSGWPDFTTTHRVFAVAELVGLQE